MNHLLKIMAVAVALVTAIPSFAVTDKEMEQARAIAAKHYLRYANNGSDYLDKLSPSSVSELSKQLKGKEKENIKSFNAVATPKDYASWDKQKLVEYWSKTFFNAPGLNADGKRCLSILAKNLNKMTVASPKPAETKPAEANPAAAAEPKPAEAKPAEAKPAEAKPADTKPADTKPADAKKANTKPATQQTAAPAAREDQDQAVENAVAQAAADSGTADEQPKKSSNTGWYIAILVVLVGVVIWLVMYASKSMKETGATLADHQAGEKEIREAKRAAKEEQNKMREQYASSLTSKNDEIKQLKAQYAAMENELAAAKRDAESARRELDAAKRELTTLRQRTAPKPQATQPKATQPKAPEQQAPAAPKPQSTQQKQPVAGRQGGLPPVVFLSNVNQKGLFTKASRSLNVESSVYRMDVPDGFHGRFRVVNDPDILERLIGDPELWLAGGCNIENPEDADIAVEVVTLEQGEALYADNSCRVTKKARIKFI